MKFLSGNMVGRKYIPWMILALLILVLPIVFLFGGMLGKLPFETGSVHSPGWNLRVLGLIGKTFLIGFTVALLNTLLALPLAWIFEKYHFSMKNLWMALLLVPILIPPYIYAIGWIYVLGEEGWFNRFLIDLFQFNAAPLSIYGFWGTVVVLSGWLFPLNFLLVRASARQSIAFKEAATLVAGKYRIFFRIVLPMMWPGLAAGFVFSFILAASSYNVPGALRVNVLPTEIFVRFGAFFDHDQAALVSLPMVAFMVLLLLFGLKALGKKDRFAIGEAPASKEVLSSSGQRWLGFILFLFVAIVLLVPVSSLLIRAGGFSNYFDALGNAGRQILSSLTMAGTGAVLVSIIGFFIAFVSYFSRSSARPWIHFFVFLPFIVPSTVNAIALLRFWNLPIFGSWVVDSGAVILLGYFRLMPMPYIIGLVALSKIPGGFVETARVQGAGSGKIIRKILLPLSGKAILGALFLTLIFCLAEIDGTLLIHPPGYESLPVRIYSLLHYGANEMVAALSLLQVLIVGGLVILSLPWIRSILFDKMLYIRIPQKRKL